MIIMCINFTEGACVAYAVLLSAMSPLQEGVVKFPSVCWSLPCEPKVN